ncbi:MAG: type I methionyl aminopeptidase [Elusimicrobiota bacterium]|jgi:methionyl aminopeptidase|nr:type I methionyl aminopeptidase [Elusimicrobiota bacterium]
MFNSIKVELKTQREIEKMRIAGKLVGEILNSLETFIKPGISTQDIEDFVLAQIKDAKMDAAFLGYPKGSANPFPCACCISINEEVVHGRPNPNRKLKDGDIVSVDTGTIYDGYYGDAAKTYAVGQISQEAKKLLAVTEQALENAIKIALPNNRLGDIGWTVQTTAEENGFSVVRDYGGHGIGRNLHEDPHIQNFGKKNTGLKLEAGMVLAIEPMLNIGTYKVKTLADGWTVVTKDSSLSAHFEHTIAITKDGNEVLTRM